jgi:hypothetical protein
MAADAAMRIRGAVATLAVACCTTSALADMPHASAAPAAAATAVTLVNPGFEAPDAAPPGFPGWTASVHSNPRAYAFAIDTGVHHAGTASLRITRVGDEPWGMITQALPPAGLTGRTIEWSAWLRIDKAAGPGAVLSIATTAHGATDRVVFLEPALAGTKDWTQARVRLAIPPGTSVVEVSAMLQGPGTLWVDDAKLEVLP